MTCKKCGSFIENGASFCTNCGEKYDPVQEVNEASRENAYENRDNMNYNNGSYPNGGYSSQNNIPYSQGSPEYRYPAGNDKAAGVKDYLKWMLLYPLLIFIPGVGFIIYLILCFKNAFDDSFKARANYFKAILISQAISIVIAIIFFIFMFSVLGSVATTGVDMFEELYPELFEEFNKGYNTLRIILGK